MAEWTDPPERAATDQWLEEALTHLRRLSAVLPETAEVDLLGAPAFRAAARMFATVELDDNEVPVVRFKATGEAQRALLADDRFRSDPLTGHHGWTLLRADQLGDPDDLDELLVASYRLVAPADVVAQLDALLDRARD